MPTQPFPQITDQHSNASAVIRCVCGADTELVAVTTVCACGREVAHEDDGVFTLASTTPYWGEAPHSEMSAVLRQGTLLGWRQAVKNHLPANLHHYICSDERAAFEDILELTPSSRILDVGAGLGGISARLALRHHVVALEGVSERAQFIALRKREDRLEKLTVINGDINSVEFTPSQFDVIVVNGVLEWVALFDHSAHPREIQRRFLDRLRRLLRPGGIIYLGIENRFGYWQFMGAIDHSGVPFTSLLPRFAADLVCRYLLRTKHRSDQNAGGYRTYTYSFFGFQKLFRDAGLIARGNYVSRLGYNIPTELIPLQSKALEFYFAARQRPGSRWAAKLKQTAARVTAREFLWRLFGCDFVFLLQSAQEPLPHSELLARFRSPADVTVVAGFNRQTGSPEWVSKTALAASGAERLRHEYAQLSHLQTAGADIPAIISWEDTARCIRLVINGAGLARVAAPVLLADSESGFDQAVEAYTRKLRAAA